MGRSDQSGPRQAAAGYVGTRCGSGNLAAVPAQASGTGDHIEAGSNQRVLADLNDDDFEVARSGRPPNSTDSEGVLPRSCQRRWQPNSLRKCAPASATGPGTIRRRQGERPTISPNFSGRRSAGTHGFPRRKRSIEAFGWRRSDRTTDAVGEGGGRTIGTVISCET